MTTTNVGIPTLSREGWVRNLSQQVDYMLSCFFTALYSQSNVYYGNVGSLVVIVRENSSDLLRMESEISDHLSTLFNNVFDSGQVNVSVEKVDDDTNNYAIVVDAVITNKGEEYSVGKIVSLYSGQIERIQSIQ